MKEYYSIIKIALDEQIKYQKRYESENNSCY